MADKLRLWVAVEGNLHVCSLMFVGVFQTDACNSTVFATHPLWHMTYQLLSVGVHDREGCTEQAVVRNVEKTVAE